LERRLGGPPGRSGRFGENSWTYRDSNSDLLVVQPVASHYTDYAIPVLVLPWVYGINLMDAETKKNLWKYGMNIWNHNRFDCLYQEDEEEEEEEEEEEGHYT
jgi:hypothetical protein